MRLETKRLIIRPFVMEDINDVHEYLSQEGVVEKAGLAATQSFNETREILKNWIKNGFKHAIVLKDTGKVIGHISIDPDSEEGREDTREFGFVLNKNYHRKGVMTEAVKAVMARLYSEGIEYIWACCFIENTASRKLIEKCGFIFQQDGKYYSDSLKKEFNSYEYCLSKEEWEKSCNVQ